MAVGKGGKNEGMTYYRRIISRTRSTRGLIGFSRSGGGERETSFWGAEGGGGGPGFRIRRKSQ